MKYLIVKTEKREVKFNKQPQLKDMRFMDSGNASYDLKNLNTSKLPKLISKIPKVNQKELIKKGKTRFAIITKTFIYLELEQDETHSNNSE